jgi:fructokinase
MGRLGLPVHFISEYGTDKIGRAVDAFLAENNVDTQYVRKFSDGKTALAIAFLDENNNARYDFYKIFPKERHLTQDIPFNKDDILLFGSSYSVSHILRLQLTSLIKRAKEAGAVVIYDPNFRKAYLKDMDVIKHYITENMELADIVKGSDEDFKIIFGTDNSLDTYNIIRDYCNNFIYTKGKDEVDLHTTTLNAAYAVPQIEPVSTIGAGDNFNVGVIYSLFNKSTITNADIDNIAKCDWDDIIDTGIKFAVDVCQNEDNYLSQRVIRDFGLVREQTS